MCASASNYLISKSRSAAKEREKLHLDAHNTVEKDPLRAMWTFITVIAVNLTDEDIVTEIIHPDFFDKPLTEYSRE